MRAALIFLHFFQWGTDAPGETRAQRFFSNKGEREIRERGRERAREQERGRKGLERVRAFAADNS